MYFVGFTDKTDTLHSLDDPTTFLSEKALNRRTLHNMAVTITDLPVDRAYVAGVTSAGAKHWLTSKWMNGIVVAANGSLMDTLLALPYVDTTYYVAPFQYQRTSPTPQIPNLDRPAPAVDTVPVTENFYGFGWKNIIGMKGDSLHRMGFRGNGVTVAVMDGGFPYADWKYFLGYDNEAAVPANYDVVEQDSTAFDGGSHGSTVLSTMATFRPFLFVGTAPAARYVLFKTENGQGEHRLEEINYAVALEIADSAGVDIVNSSLGYTTFGDKTMDYTYEDLDGTRSPASRAATLAFQRGMILITSAGNSGGDEWRHIGIPADATEIFSIGALNRDGTLAYFSSVGPTPDGRIKPDVSALGVEVFAMTGSGRGITAANGTSLAAPLVAGLIACLRGAAPEATNQEILDAVRATADQSDRPDSERGYGQPDFAAAYRYLMQARREP